jgi:hypothetical protein
VVKITNYKGISFLSSLLGPTIPFGTLFSNTPNVCFFLKARVKVLRHKAQGKFANFCILIFNLLDRKREDNSELHGFKYFLNL